IADFADLGFVNEVFVAAVGRLKITIILRAILVFIDRGHQSFGLINQNTLEKDILYPKVRHVGNYIFAWVTREEPKFDKLNLEFDQHQVPLKQHSGTANDSI